MNESDPYFYESIIGYNGLWEMCGTVGFSMKVCSSIAHEKGHPGLLVNDFSSPASCRKAEGGTGRVGDGVGCRQKGREGVQDGWGTGWGVDRRGGRGVEDGWGTGWGVDRRGGRGVQDGWGTGWGVDRRGGRGYRTGGGRGGV